MTVWNSVDVWLAFVQLCGVKYASPLRNHAGIQNPLNNAPELRSPPTIPQRQRTVHTMQAISRSVWDFAFYMARKGPFNYGKTSYYEALANIFIHGQTFSGIFRQFQVFSGIFRHGTPTNMYIIDSIYLHAMT